MTVVVRGEGGSVAGGGKDNNIREHKCSSLELKGPWVVCIHAAAAASAPAWKARVATS